MKSLHVRYSLVLFIGLNIWSLQVEECLAWSSLGRPPTRVAYNPLILLDSMRGGGGDGDEKERDLEETCSASLEIEKESVQTTLVTATSLSDALAKASSKGSLLVVVSQSDERTEFDIQVLKSLSSKAVRQILRRKPRKTSKDGSTSFLLWNIEANSAESRSVIRQVKPQLRNKTKKKIPLLLVIYPAPARDRQGRLQLVPQMLAQHPCNSPLTPKSVATWLNEVRKKHAIFYAKMQRHQKEQEVAAERQQGFSSGIKSKKEREVRVARQKAERLEKERLERIRKEELRKRRVELTESLPKEPQKGESLSKTISLRLPNGKAYQRRFFSQDTIGDVFNWADVMSETDRETFTLTTLNGKSSFSWEEDNEQTLAESGLQKMIGLRLLGRASTLSNDSELNDIS